MIEDFRLRVFQTVCKKGSFTAAAKELGISQPAVSQQIAELEKALGRSLFDRQVARVELNADGRKFEEYASQILHWYDAANEAFSPDPPKPLEVELDSGRTVQIWACGEDIHLKLKTE
ncbi:MAG: LysR family transcriptional regulator [Candidatus Cryptobacteroides sp.]